MAAMRSSSVCLQCQARQAALGRRRYTISKRCLNTAVALRPEDDGFLLNSQNANNQSEGPVLRPEITARQWKLQSPIDELREAALGFDALWKQRDLRLQVLRNLSNPWPARAGPHVRTMRVQDEFKEINAPPMSHEMFREKIREAVGHKPIRTLLRLQLLRCEWPREILRVIAVAMQSREVAEQLVALHEPLMRSLYRCRQNVSDPDVLKTLNVITTRFRNAELAFDPQLLFMALKFAARARSLQAMKKYLKAIREAGLTMSSNVFRSVVAKFSIGHRGLGEIRNGRWRRSDLQQVIQGFDDAKDLPPEQQYHFGSFLDRTDWQYLHGWVAILARCKDSDAVWHEWQLWKESQSYKKPRQLIIKDRTTHAGMNSRTRGNLWFIEQILCAGDTARAWGMLEETGLGIRAVKPRIRDRMLDKVEHATVWTEELKEEVMAKYDRDLGNIEQALGVKWVKTGEDGEGQHELYMDQGEALDKLGADDWKMDQDYGYPYETDPLVPERERALHDAAEGKVAK